MSGRWFSCGLGLVLVLVAACASRGAGTPAQVGAQTAPVESDIQPAVSPHLGYPRVSNLDLSALRRGEAPLKIRYALDAPALVRLRLVDSDSPGLILRTLLDWEPRAAGAQVEPWDGLDSRGEAVNPRRVSVALVAEPDPEAGAAYDWAALEALRYPEHKHYTHDRAVCSDLAVRLVSPLPGSSLEGVVDVCAELPGSRGMPDSEYHVAIYLEGRTAWDGRLPVAGPFCQAWDTRHVPDGAYRLAMTFNDLHDHAGSDWVSVTVSNGD